MLIDSHMYCFPPVDSAAGYPTAEEKMRLAQAELGGHSQPVRRVRDRAPADNTTLIDPRTGQLRDVRWTRHNGQLAWIYEGETYTKQHTPPMLHNLESPPELMIAEMDYAGVEMGLMHTYPTLGEDDFVNAFLQDSVSRFPDRLMRLIRITEATIPADIDGAIRKIADQVDAEASIGLQFIPGFWYEPTGGGTQGRSEPWDGGSLRPFWDAVAALKIPVFFTLLGGKGAKLYDRSWSEGYLEEQGVLTRWMDRYADTSAVITHGLPWRVFMEGEEIRLPEAIWEVFRSPRCYLQLLIPIQMGGMWEYPWKEAEPVVKECVDRIGADHLMYGTDMPMVARFCTYRQTIDQFRAHCDFLSDGERQDILGGTIARVMGIEEA